MQWQIMTLHEQMAHVIHYIMDLLILFRNDSTVWKESVWIPIHAATDSEGIDIMSVNIRSM